MGRRNHQFLFSDEPWGDGAVELEQSKQSGRRATGARAWRLRAHGAGKVHARDRFPDGDAANGAVPARPGVRPPRSAACMWLTHLPRDTAPTTTAGHRALAPAPGRARERGEPAPRRALLVGRCHHHRHRPIMHPGALRLQPRRRRPPIPPVLMHAPVGYLFFRAHAGTIIGTYS